MKYSDFPNINTLFARDLIGRWSGAFIPDYSSYKIRRFAKRRSRKNFLIKKYIGYK